MTESASRKRSGIPEDDPSVLRAERARQASDGNFTGENMGTEHQNAPFISSPMGIGLCVFLAVAALFLVLEHRAHLLGAWPLLLLLLCVGMHLFMHRGHGGHTSQAGEQGGRHDRRGNR